MPFKAGLPTPLNMLHHVRKITRSQPDRYILLGEQNPAQVLVMNLPRREGGVFSAAHRYVGTHQFRRDALLGHSAHLGDPSLHLCFDVALLSSSEPDPGDTLRDKSSLVHPLILPIH